MAKTLKKYALWFMAIAVSYYGAVLVFLKLKPAESPRMIPAVPVEPLVNVVHTEQQAEALKHAAEEQAVAVKQELNDALEGESATERRIRLAKLAEKA